MYNGRFYLLKRVYSVLPPAPERSSIGRTAMLAPAMALCECVDLNTLSITAFAIKDSITHFFPHVNIFSAK